MMYNIDRWNEQNISPPVRASNKFNRRGRQAEQPGTPDTSDRVMTGAAQEEPLTGASMGEARIPSGRDSAAREGPVER